MDEVGPNLVILNNPSLGGFGKGRGRGRRWRRRMASKNGVCSTVGHGVRGERDEGRGEGEEEEDAYALDVEEWKVTDHVGRWEMMTPGWMDGGGN